jgi:protein SCO1/2
MNKRSKGNASVISIALNVVILLAAGYLYFSSEEKNVTGNLKGIHEAYKCLGGDFVLKSAKGPVSLADYRGKTVVLYFGYASCPDVCPTSLGLLSLALRKLTPEELEKLQVMFISVDPERDSVEELKSYANAFHPNIIGVTGSAKEIATAARHYGVMYAKVDMPNSALGYSVDHSSRYYVVGKDGAVKKIIEHGTAPEEIVTHLRSVMK